MDGEGECRLSSNMLRIRVWEAVFPKLGVRLSTNNLYVICYGTIDTITTP